MDNIFKDDIIDMNDIQNMWNELSKDEQNEFIEHMKSISGLIKNACGLIVEAVNEQ